MVQERNETFYKAASHLQDCVLLTGKAVEGMTSSKEISQYFLADYANSCSNKGEGASIEGKHNRELTGRGISLKENQANGERGTTVGKGDTYCGCVKQKARHLYLAQLLEASAVLLCEQAS